LLLALGVFERTADRGLFHRYAAAVSSPKMWSIKPTSEEMVDAGVINFDDWVQALKAIVLWTAITHIAKPSSNPDTGFGKPIK
jgi:hypothetical protein